MKFTGLTDIDAAVDAYSAIEFGNSSIFSIQPDLSAVVNPEAASYFKLGSNISDLVADMVPFKNFNLVPLATIAEGQYFPFKYMAIQYKANTATGNITFYIERKTTPWGI